MRKRANGRIFSLSWSLSLSLAAIAAVAIGSARLAGAHDPGEAPEDSAGDAPKAVASAKPEEPGPNRGRVSFSLVSDFTNAYMFRGIKQERNGFIWQPAGQLDIKLWENEDAPGLQSVTLGVGLWNSFHSKKTLASGSGPTNLYETDVYPSLTFGFEHGFEMTLLYYVYYSPNGAFKTEKEFALGLSYDDSELLGDFALNPSVTFAFELENTAFGEERGSWVGLNLSPTIAKLEHDTFPVELSMPIELGIGIDDYYEVAGFGQDRFGYLSVGLVANIGLGFIPADFGAWSVNLGCRGYYLSEILKQANNGDEFYPVGVGSLLLEY